MHRLCRCSHSSGRRGTTLFVYSVMFSDNCRELAAAIRLIQRREHCNSRDDVQIAGYRVNGRLRGIRVRGDSFSSTSLDDSAPLFVLRRWCNGNGHDSSGASILCVGCWPMYLIHLISNRPLVNIELCHYPVRWGRNSIRDILRDRQDRGRRALHADNYRESRRLRYGYPHSRADGHPHANNRFASC